MTTSSRLTFVVVFSALALAAVFVFLDRPADDGRSTLEQVHERTADAPDAITESAGTVGATGDDPEADEPAPLELTAFYVAPDADGTGTLTDPADLAETLLSQEIAPGTTVFLRGGTYVGYFTSELVGTSDQPITVRPFEGEHAVIDGFGAEPIDAEALNIAGAHARFVDLEITNSEPSRERSESGSLGRAGLVQIFGESISLIGNYIHDGGSCVGVWSAAENAEVHGNIISNCGWEGPDGGHGHGLYVQNDGEPVLIDANIIVDNFGYGIHAFATNGMVTNLQVINNIVAGAGALSADPSAWAVLVGAGTPVADIVFVGNTLAGPAPAQFGYTNPNNSGLELRGNRIVGTSDGPSLVVRNWTGFVGSDNEIFTADGGPIQVLDTELTEWDRNRYHGNDLFPGGTFATWQQPVRDANSTHSPEPPADTVVVVPNRYDDDRANVAVLTWSGAAEVTIDLSSILEAGDSYEIRNAQNLEAEPLVSGVYDGDDVVVPLAGMTARLPTGLDQPAETLDTFRVLTVTAAHDRPAPREPEDPETEA